jgi:hypothetical protein
MKAGLCLLLAVIANCLYPAVAQPQPQYPGAPSLWPGPRRSPEQNLGPNSPYNPGSPFGLRNPYDPQHRIDTLKLHSQPNPFGSDGPPNPFGPPSLAGPPSSAGPHGVIPPEPRVEGVIDQGKNGAATPAPIVPVPEFAQPLNPALTIQPGLPPAQPPVAAEPPVAPPGPGWEWVALGIGVLCLLALLLGASARNPRSVPPEGDAGEHH